MKRLGLLLGAAALVAGYFVLGLDQRLSLTGVQASLADLQAWHARAPASLAAAFVSVYVLMAALSLPGAALLTLLGGAVFGLLWGTLLASVASSVGALLAFLMARYLFRDMVSRHFGDRLKALNQGIARDGAFYLFTLRMVPVVPFFLVNLLMGLVPMKARTFYVVSQVGMLAGTLVYVNAGQQLAQLDGLAGIVSPGLLLSLALLGVFPVLAKALLAAWARRRVYQRWTRPVRFDRNLIVIGGGAAGLVSAYIGAAVRARVTLVEAHKMGGDCLNYGCVPSKALIRSAKLAHQMRQADRYGLSAQPLPVVSFRAVMARVDAVVRAVAPHDSIERYSALGVDVRQGHARLVDPWTVEITAADGKVERLTSRSIVIAAGARPVVPGLPGMDAVDCCTSDTLWAALARLDTPPARVVVLGGGPIGTELAQALARLGSQVSLVEQGPRLLAREDDDVSALAGQALQADGVQVLTGHRALGCEPSPGASSMSAPALAPRSLQVEHQGLVRHLPFDLLVCAVGRAPRLAGYGLEELGISTDKTVVTNDYLETLYPNIFAAGDVAGPYQFTHTAAHQAWHASVNALFGSLKRFKVDYRVVPCATFIDPEVARVGLNEREATEQGVAFEVTRYDIDDLDRAIADGVAHGFVKVLTVPGKDRILGATIVGEHAADLLAEFVLAMKWGLGLNKILSTIHTYPTLSESSKYLAGEWKRAHAPDWALAWSAWFHQWRRG